MTSIKAHGEPSQEGRQSAGIDPPPKDTQSFDQIDAYLEISGLRNLVVDILVRTDDVLKKWNKTMERYIEKTDLGQTSVTRRESNRAKDFTVKLRWAIKDKATLDELLSTLVSLNDGLENLLPRTDKESLKRGLAGEYLSTSSQWNGSSATGATISAGGEAKASRILSVRELNRTEAAEDPEASNKSKPRPYTDRWEKPRESKGSSNSPSSWRIPSSSFQHLVEPMLDYHHVRTERRDFRGPENYVPLPRSFCLFHSRINFDEGGATIDGPTQHYATEVDGTARDSPTVVLIEWRLQQAETSASEISEEELSSRGEHIVSLLHQTAVADEDFKVLDCIGYTLSTGHTPDGIALPLVGFVYKYPSSATPNALPITLRSILDDAYEADDCSAPSLEKRLQLSKVLATALFQLQCAGWIHRKLSSYNVLFFPDRTGGEIDLGSSYLSGWQYSRPDDQMYQAQSEYSGKGIGDLDMYVHPARLISRRCKMTFLRFRRSYDIYSLGVVLLEISFWEPIIAMGSDDDRKTMRNFGSSDSGNRCEAWYQTYIDVAKKELSAEMGRPIVTLS